MFFIENTYVLEEKHPCFFQKKLGMILENVRHDFLKSSR